MLCDLMATNTPCFCMASCPFTGMEAILSWFFGSDDEEEVAREPCQLVNLTGQTVRLCRQLDGSRLYEPYATLKPAAGRPVPYVERVATKAIEEPVTIDDGSDIWTVPTYSSASASCEYIVRNLPEQQSGVTLIVTSDVHRRVSRPDLRHPIIIYDDDQLCPPFNTDDADDILYCAGLSKE